TLASLNPALHRVSLALPVRPRVLSPDSPTRCSAQRACHGRRLRAERGAPSGATRGLGGNPSEPRGTAGLMTLVSPSRSAFLTAGLTACGLNCRFDIQPVREDGLASPSRSPSASTSALFSLEP